MTAPSSPSKGTAEQVRFQWRAMMRKAALEPGWQDHLTSHLFAVATVQVPGKGPLPPTILQVQVMGNLEKLYKVRVREGAVDVRAAYDALASIGTGLPPPCELLIKTTDGAHGLTLDPPTPPSLEEWQDMVRQLWSQLQAEPQLRLDWGTAPPQPGQSGIFLPQRLLFSRFELAPQIQWEPMPQRLLHGRKSSNWQRQLRFVRDPIRAWLLHAQVGWREEEEAAALVPEEALEDNEEPEVRLWEPDTVYQNGEAGLPGLPEQTEWRALKPPARASIHWRDGLKRRGGLMLAGALLLAFIVLATSVLAFGVFGDNPQAGPSGTAITPASPTSTSDDQASPTAQATLPSAPTGATTPNSTAQPTNPPTATATTAAVVNWSVAVQGSTSQRCSPHPRLSSLTLIIDNSKSSVALTWQVSITDTDPAGKVWASASPTSGTIPAGKQAQTTLTPISTLCQDMASSQNPITYHASVSGSAAGQTKQSTVSVTVRP